MLKGFVCVGVRIWDGKGRWERGVVVVVNCLVADGSGVRSGQGIICRRKHVRDAAAMHCCAIDETDEAIVLIDWL